MDSPKHNDTIVTSFHSPNTIVGSAETSPNTSTSGLNPYATNFAPLTTTSTTVTTSDGIVFDTNELLRFEDDLPFIATDLINNNNNNNTINNNTINNGVQPTTDELLSFSGNFNEALTFSATNNTLPTNINNNNYNNAPTNSNLFTNALNSDSALDAAIGEILNDPSLYPSFDPSLNNSDNITTTTNNVTNSNTPNNGFTVDNNSFSNMNFMNNNTNNTNPNTPNTNTNPQFGFDFGTLNDSGNLFAPPELWDFSNLPPSVPSTPKGPS
jgi:hypothetical protein